MWGLTRMLSINSVTRLPCIIGANIHTVRSTVKPILRTDCKILNKRTFFGIFRRPTKEQYKLSDNIPSQYTLIYRNTMDRYLFLVQLVTTVSGALVLLSIIIKHDFADYQMIYVKKEDPPRSSNNEIYVYLSTFIGIVVLLQFFLSKMPLRIYYLGQQKRYIFIFPGAYPKAIKRLNCKIGDVDKLPAKGFSLSPWKEEKYSIKNKQDVIMLEHYFRRPADLHVMMGIQKDPDIEE